MIIAFSVALAFKAQTIFLAPLLLMLCIKDQLSWRYLFVAPAVYVILMLQANWLGRPFFDLMTVYLTQAGTYDKLSMNAPNLYALIPNLDYSAVTAVGIAVTTTCVAFLLIAVARSTVRFNRELIVLASTFIVGIMPFLLPKMHERYFFPADLISIALAFYNPRLWFIPLTFEVSSGMAYAPGFFHFPPPRGLHLPEGLEGRTVIAGSRWDRLKRVDAS